MIHFVNIKHQTQHFGPLEQVESFSTYELPISYSAVVQKVENDLVRAVRRDHVLGTYTSSQLIISKLFQFVRNGRVAVMYSSRQLWHGNSKIGNRRTHFPKKFNCHVFGGSRFISLQDLDHMSCQHP